MAGTSNKHTDEIKQDKKVDASAYLIIKGGSEFEDNPLPSSRLGSSSLCTSRFLGYLVNNYIDDLSAFFCMPVAT
jgi:hypothetical protein